MKVRAAEKRDAAAIRRLYREFNRDRIALGTGEAGFKYLDSESRWMELLADKDCTTLVAEEKGVVVGFITVRADVFNPFSKVGRMGEIDLMVVEEKLRRRGIGTVLLREALNYLGGRGFTHVILNVRAKNPARLFWGKMGFKGVSESEYSSPGGGEEKIIYMIRSVK